MMDDEQADALVGTGVVVSELSIKRVFSENGSYIICRAEGGPNYLEILGMLELAKDMRMWFDVEDDE